MILWLTLSSIITSTLLVVAYSQSVISQSLLTNSSTLATYKDPDNLITIDYPGDWIASTRGLFYYGDIIGFFSPFVNESDAVAESLTISKDSYLNNITLNQYINSTINILSRSIVDFSILESESGNTIVSGYPAYRLVFDHSSDDGQYKLKTMYIMIVKGINDNKAYFITYTAEADQFNTYLPLIQKMIDSMQIENDTDTS